MWLVTLMNNSLNTLSYVKVDAKSTHKWLTYHVCQGEISISLWVSRTISAKNSACFGIFHILRLPAFCFMVWVGPLLADSLYVPPVSFGTTFWSPASLLADALQLVPLYSFSAIGSSIPSILQNSLHSIFLLPVPLYLLPTVSLSTAVGSIFLTINQLLRSAYSAYPFSAPRSFAAAPFAPSSS